MWVGGVTYDAKALELQRSVAVSWIGGREELIVFTAVLTTLHRRFQTAALHPPAHTEMQLVMMLFIVSL